MKALKKYFLIISILSVSNMWSQELEDKEQVVEQRVSRWMQALETNLDLPNDRKDSLNAILSNFAEQMYDYRQAEQELKVAMMKMRDQRIQKLLSTKQYAHYHKTMSDLQKKEFAKKQRQRQMEQMEEQRRQQNLEPNFNRGRRRNRGIGNRRGRGF